MRTRLFLSPSNTSLVVPSDVEHIHAVADSSTGAFDIVLPDVTMPEHREYIIYNYPSSGAGNDITVKPVTGQFLINGDTSHVLKPFDTVSFVADLKTRWLLTDVNVASVGPKGDKGDDGAPGTDGTNGVDGAPGANGASGIPTTVLDTSTVDLTLSGSQLSAVVLPAGVNHSQLSTLNSGDINHMTAAQISALHTRQHALNSASDHTGSIAENTAMVADASGLPKASAFIKETTTGVGVGVVSTTRKFSVGGAMFSDADSKSQVGIFDDTTAYNASPCAGIVLGTKYGAATSFIDMGGIQIGKEKATDGSYAGYLDFLTRPYPGNITRRMRIDSIGNIGVGNIPLEKFDVAGAIKSSGPVTENSANKVTLSQEAGGIGMVGVWGPDISTHGIVKIYVTKSNGDEGISPLEINKIGIKIIGAVQTDLTVTPLATTLPTGCNHLAETNSVGTFFSDSSALNLHLFATLSDDEAIDLGDLSIHMYSGTIEIGFSYASGYVNLAVWDIGIYGGVYVCTLIRETPSIGAGYADSANTDGKLCVYISGGHLYVKNRLGNSKKISGYVRLNDHGVA